MNRIKSGKIESLSFLMSYPVNPKLCMDHPESLCVFLCIMTRIDACTGHIPLVLMMFSSVDAISVMLVEKGSEPVRL